MMLRLANSPCSSCGTDTLHKFLVCTVCGAVTQTPADLRDAAYHRYRKKLVSRIKRDGLAAALNYSAKKKAHDGATRNKWLAKSAARDIDDSKMENIKDRQHGRLYKYLKSRRERTKI